MSLILIVVGLVLAVTIVTSAFKVPQKSVRAAAGVVAIIVFGAFFTASSMRYIGEDEIGVVIKTVGSDMPAGQIIATQGEKGPQAITIPPGWKPWLWPGLFDVEMSKVVQIESGEVGLVTAKDGLPLPRGVAFAPEWPETETRKMVEQGDYFLGAGKGYKGPQASVLTPGAWRINPKLFVIERVPVTNIEKATVGVVKSNVGGSPTTTEAGRAAIVARGQRGIWMEPYTPQKLYLNTKAYEITKISTKQQIIRYGIGGAADDSEIEVRTNDGNTFPVDVRVEYQIFPTDAPIVVAELGDDQDQLHRRLASTVRAIFRNNAEKVKALDYVNERSKQEDASTAAIAEEMKKVGVTIVAVRIGSIAGDGSLAEILKTQTDRELAVQQQDTYKIQQLAAQEKKELNRTEQEAEEERTLATARYAVQIADAAKERKIIEADAEAEAIRIRAEAQSEAYRVIAEQIGAGNAALVELLKIVGTEGIDITPRVMVIGDGGGTGGSQETTALIGTMLDHMMTESEPVKSPKKSEKPPVAKGE